MCPNVTFWDLKDKDSIFDNYLSAYKQGGVHVIVEYPEMYYQ
jgi:hypothetical protein